MSIEKKTIRSDIPGHHTMLNAAYSGSPQEEGRRLVVGRDITLNGDIASCDHLVVEGTVHAQSFGARRMDIMESGFFAGSAEVVDAVIAGRFEGKLKVSGRLTVRATGRLYGEVEYGTLEVEGGAKIEGHLAAQAAAVVEALIPAAVVEVNTNDNNTAASDETSGETTEERPKVFRRAIGY